MRAAYAHEFANNNDVEVNGNPFNNDISGSRGELGTGVAMTLTDKVSLHADFDYTRLDGQRRQAFVRAAGNLLAEQQEGAGPKLQLLASDQKNTVLKEVSSEVTNDIAYSAYGHRSAEMPVSTHLGYNGVLREEQTGLYLLGNGYRPYNPCMMRFHSPDSWSPFGRGGLNAYAYCEGQPVLNDDPDGHMRFGTFLRLFRPTTESIRPNSVRPEFLKNTKNRAATVRPIKEKHINLLKKNVGFYQLNKADVEKKLKTAADLPTEIRQYERDYGPGTFVNHAAAARADADLKLSDAEESLRWAKKRIGKKGVTREFEADLKANAREYDRRVDRIRRGKGEEYLGWTGDQLHRSNQEKARNWNRGGSTKHYLGDGNS